ncbi:MAG: pentapeptide repeat-containing protein [Planctomycetales bacterium]|nr:pentapeptide repeat-containing protein [Planctomycetales bacterium]
MFKLHRIKSFVVVATLVASQLVSSNSNADIFRWDNGELIPGSEGVEPGPAAQLTHWNTNDRNLQYADFENGTLADSQFTFSWLQNANFSNADVRNSSFRRAQLQDADFTNAIIAGAAFNEPALTSEQFYSTASYQTANLNGIAYSANVAGWDLSSQSLQDAVFTTANASGATFAGSDLSRAVILSANLNGTDFSDAMLSGAMLSRSDLAGANFANANLSTAVLDGVSFSSTSLRSANLTGAVLDNAKFMESDMQDSVDMADANVNGASFRNVTAGGFKPAYFYQTQSYKDRALERIDFSLNDLSDWDLSSQNLIGAMFQESAFGADTNLLNADIRQADFSGSSGFTREHLESTRSFKNRDLRNVTFRQMDLSGWDLSRQFLANADFTNSDLTDVDFTDSVILGTRFLLSGITIDQIASTRSYEERNLQRLWLVSEDVEGLDLSFQNLRDSEFRLVNLKNVNFTRADLSNSYINGELEGANFSSANLEGGHIRNTLRRPEGATYNQWTVFPSRFDPVAEGMILIESPAGDFNADGMLDVQDLDELADRIVSGFDTTEFWIEAMFDLDGDRFVSPSDLDTWVKELRMTWYGDANLDGEFNSKDLVQVFAANTYEDGITANSDWSTGDWNGDSEFDSSDLVKAFSDGGYERGAVAARIQIAAVPEPSGIGILLIALPLLVRRRFTATGCNAYRH